MIRQVHGLLALALVLVLGGCRSDLQGDLDEQSANEILVVLARSGLDGRKERAGAGSRAFAVSVPAADLSRAVELMRNAGLPRARHSGFREVYAERGLVPGRLEERALFVSALQAEIAQTLESVEGVITARVHATLRPEPSGAVRLAGVPDASPISAAVLITHKSVDGGRTPLSETAIQKIVANAIDGLEPDRVAVVFCPRHPAGEAVSQMAPAETASSGLRWMAGLAAGLALLIGLGLCLARSGWRPTWLSRQRT